MYAAGSRQGYHAIDDAGGLAGMTLVVENEASSLTDKPV